MIEPTSIPSEHDPMTRTTTVPVETGRTFDRPFARVSWGAIFAGAVIAVGIQLVLTLIGLAIGLATLNPAAGTSPSGTSLGAGAAIWLVISSIISLFLGGYFAARLGGSFNGWLHGLTTWGVVTIFTMLLLTTAAGGLIGTASGLASFAANNGSSLRLPPALQQQVDQWSAEASRATNQATTQAQNNPQATEANARQAGQRAATGGAVGSGGAALGLILGALAAAFGGRAGQQYPVVRGAYRNLTQRETHPES
jgi:autotransporter adhesin